MKKFLGCLYFCLISASLIFANGSKEDDQKLIFASDALWPPMEFINSDMEITGFDIELLAAMAEAGGFTYEVKNTAWDGIFAGLATGEYDAVISSVTITEERQKTMDFTTPYVQVGQIIIAPKEASDALTLEALKGEKVGAQIGTTGAFLIKDESEAILKTYDDVGLAVEDLYNKNLKAVVCDSTTAANFIMENEKYNKTLKLVGEPLTAEYYGIALKKGNKDLLDLLNSSLQAVIDSGKKDELVEKWLR